VVNPLRYVRFQKCAEFDCLGWQLSSPIADLVKFQGRNVAVQAVDKDRLFLHRRSQL
jgi:hypothetical protein